MVRETKKSIGLSTIDIEGFTRLLLEKRCKIVGSVTAIEACVFHRDPADLSRMPIHMADLGSDTFEIDNSLNLVDAERRLLREIDEALGRIENGTYGICLGTSKPIGFARLQAIPWAKYGVEYAHLVEQGLVDINSVSEKGPHGMTGA